MPGGFIIFNKKLYFTADDGINGRELYVTDGTPGGTSRLTDINPGAASSFDNQAGELQGVIGSQLYFLADDGTHGKELWKTDGTNITLVKDITPGIAGTSFTLDYFVFGNQLLFTISNGDHLELWKTDGTSVGTILIKDFGSFSSFYPTQFLFFNNKVYFSAYEQTAGNELWVTDGTVAGTQQLIDINIGSNSSFPQLLNSVIIGSKFYFSALTDSNGYEIWQSDGTAGGTHLFKDIYPGSNGSIPYFLLNYDVLTFRSTNSTLFNGKMFFVADDSTHGRELWVTDGISVTLVKDINPGIASSSVFYNYLYSAQGLFFSADDGTTGTEPWKSDGTSIGTARIADLNPGVNGSFPSYLLVNNSILYFAANDGDNANNLTDLYRINGAVTLPVTLLNFTATALPNKVQLNWTTSSELNSSHFTVERSTDGSHFNAIAQVVAAGNSSVEKKYLYNDGEALHLGASSLYYRIQMIDKDGKSKSSGVLNVRLKEPPFGVTVLPNPVQQQLSVLFNAAGAKKIGLNVTDANGKLVYRQELPTGRSAYQQNINVAGFAKGIYFIQLVTDQQVRTLKFVKE